MACTDPIRRLYRAVRSSVEGGSDKEGTRKGFARLSLFPLASAVSAVSVGGAGVVW
jgi:hypothetical protein